MNLTTQPTQWIGAFVPNRYVFNLDVPIGNYSGVIFSENVVFALTSPFTAYAKIGDILLFNFLSLSYQAVITRITSNVTARIISPTIFSPAQISTPIAVTLRVNQKMDLNLFAGRLAIGEDLNNVATFLAVPRFGIYDVDISGMVQCLFSNIGVPPVTGVDNELFINYLLKASYQGAVYDLGTVKNSVYSTTQATGTSYHLLREGLINLFTGQPSLYSYTLGNRLITASI